MPVGCLGARRIGQPLACVIGIVEAGGDGSGIAVGGDGGRLGGAGEC